MHENEQIITYVNRVRQLASTVKSMGVEIDDKELAMMVLNVLEIDISEMRSQDTCNTHVCKLSHSTHM